MERTHSELPAPTEGVVGGLAEEGTLGVDVRGLVRYCSPGAEAIFRMPATTLAGRPLNELIPRLRFSAATPGMNRVLALSWSGARGWLRLDARSVVRGEFAIDATLTNVPVDPTRLFIVSLRDASEERTTTEGVRCVVEAMAQSDDVVMLTDTDGVIEYVNPSFERVTGFAAAEAVGRTPRILNSGTHPAAHFAEMWASVRAGKEYRGVVVNRRKEGSTYHEEKTIRPLFNDAGVLTHFLSVGRNVTDRVLEMAHLENLAHRDELTGLANRGVFRDRLRHAIAHAARHRTAFALLYLDVDDFKALNDEFGHSFGDAALQELARRLRACLREEDTVARVGGDEFAVILPGAGSHDAAEAVLQKIVVALRSPLEVGDRRAVLAASVGACLYPAHAQDEPGLMRAADGAMYLAKKSDSDGVTYAWSKNAHTRAASAQRTVT
ncbi:MAG TPA: diguanylate cyclase [Burkholderiales bacterium]|nr:diguanylate cyclase [Burkholderiales bacterium]